MIITVFRRVSYLAAAACLLVALTPMHAHAAENDYDAVLVRYELTMAKVKAWEQASVAAAQALKARKDQGEEEEDEEDDGGDGNIDDLAARLDSVPEIRRAIHQARLSTREFATIGLVIFQAVTMDQVAKMNPSAKVPKNMNPANLKFVQAHRAEVQASLKAVQAASGAN